MLSFLPGPTTVPAPVLSSMVQPVVDHHAEEMATLLGSLSAPLQALFRTQRRVLPGACSATGFMEAAIRCGVKERVLVVVGGRYGERFARVAATCGKSVIRVMTHPGRALEADYLQQFLDGPQVDAVALVHAELSTGTLAPLVELATVVRARKDVLLLVDAAGSIGGIPVETDLWNLDFVFTGSDKALALPPGLALGVASQRFLERARTQEDRGRYFDVAWMDEALSRNHEPTSLPLPLLYALRAQLALIASAGGIEARWKRHHEMLTLVEEWALLRKDVQLLAQEGRRAWTCSCLRLPGGRSSADVVSSLRERGWLVASGWGTLKDSTIRIGHMGERTPGEVRELLGEMDSVLSA